MAELCRSLFESGPPTNTKSSSLSSLGSVDVEAVPKLGDAVDEVPLNEAVVLVSVFRLDSAFSALFDASTLPLTLLSPLSEPAEGVLIVDCGSLAGVLIPEAVDWCDCMAEAVVAAARPLAACAYENTGGAGAASPFGLEGVVLIVIDT